MAEFFLIEIGTVNVDSNTESVIVDLLPDYSKALNGTKNFSHFHIYYLLTQNGNLLLADSVMETSDFYEQDNCPNETSGKTHRGKTCLYGKLHDQNLSSGKYTLIDIKPYMPSEDSVKNAQKINGTELNPVQMYAVDDQEKKEMKDPIYRNSALYKINPAGKIRNVNGKIFLEPDYPVHINTTYIKVFWWFDRFDSAQYRKATECNPPYENAPRTGIFATRSPVRPNPLAMTIVKINNIDTSGRIYINGLEAYDGTPFIGMEAYDPNKDLVIDSRIPDYLEHWPRWFDDSDMYKDLTDISITKTELISLLEDDHHNTAESAYTEDYQSIKQNSIFVKGARENNLKGIDVEIPYGKITAIVGVSGSGKSSLVNDTVYAECRRRMEYLTHNRNVLPKPDADYIAGVVPAVIISQTPVHGNSMSTVGTYVNAYDYLRIIYSLVSVRHCPECGNEIVPLSTARIKKIINKLITDGEKVDIYNIDQQLVFSSDKQIEDTLEYGNGALYIKHNDSDFLLLQTTQKCYHCNKLMFELTPQTFSYINPESRCPICNGTGNTVEVDEHKIITNPGLSLLDGASPFYGKLRSFIENSNANWMKGQVFGLASAMNEDLELPWDKLSPEFREKILHGDSRMEVTFTYKNKKNGREGQITRPVEGIIGILDRLYEENGDAASLEKYMSKTICKSCNGERLGKEGRMVTVNNIRYPEAAALSFDELHDFCITLMASLPSSQSERVKSAVNALMEICDSASRLGIGYLHLSQSTSTLSGGEGQRIKLLGAYMNHMSGILYIFDEPSKGLDPRDYIRVTDMFSQLKSEGNTILMVEHNEDMIRFADYLIEIGPGAGKNGGQLVGQGTLQEILTNSKTQLSRYMQEKPGSSEIINSNPMKELISLDKLSYQNLKNISISFPKNALTCICGVSGSGKSSLMKGEIYPYFNGKSIFSSTILVDQLPIGRNSKSVIATYIGVMDEIRMLFAAVPEAAACDFNEKYFSFNAEYGQCPACKGDGKIEIKYLENSYIPCPDCNGKRYRKEILDIRYMNKNINDILCMSITEASEFFADSENIHMKLLGLCRVGLGYLNLGQSTSTLSGGEASRLKLAKELLSSKKNNTLYLLDEPTTGLHFSDIDNLLKLISELIHSGNTVVAIEHNRQFKNSSDWLIELGPGAGKRGGEVLYCGSKY